MLAANVDTVFLLMSLNGDCNLRRLERYVLPRGRAARSP